MKSNLIGAYGRAKKLDFICVINSISAIFSSSSPSLSRPDFRERTAGWQWDVTRLQAETVFERGTQGVKMCLESFGSLEIALHRIETFRYEAENDCEDDIWLKVFSRIHTKKDNPKPSFYSFFFTRNVSTVTFMILKWTRYKYPDIFWHN